MKAANDQIQYTSRSALPLIFVVAVERHEITDERPREWLLTLGQQNLIAEEKAEVVANCDHLVNTPAVLQRPALSEVEVKPMPPSGANSDSPPTGPITARKRKAKNER